MPSGYEIDNHTRLRIRKLLQEGGITQANIAQRCGCGIRSVEYEAFRMRQEEAGRPVPMAIAVAVGGLLTDEFLSTTAHRIFSASAAGQIKGQDCPPICPESQKPVDECGPPLQKSRETTTRGPARPAGPTAIPD